MKKVIRAAVVVGLFLVAACSSQPAPAGGVPSTPCPSPQTESEQIKTLRKQNYELMAENSDLQTTIINKNKTINNLLHATPNAEGSPLRKN